MSTRKIHRKPASIRKLHPISIRITEPQRKLLERLSRLTGLPSREHIRRALDSYLDVKLSQG